MGKSGLAGAGEGWVGGGEKLTWASGAAGTGLVEVLGVRADGAGTQQEPEPGRAYLLVHERTTWKVQEYWSRVAWSPACA